MSEFIGFKLFSIYSEGEDFWWSTEDGWVDELQDDCLFPSYTKAFDELQQIGHTYGVYVYEVEIPQKERHYMYQKAHLPCDVE